MTEDLRTPEQWQSATGIVIVDPDGPARINVGQVLVGADLAGRVRTSRGDQHDKARAVTRVVIIGNFSVPYTTESYWSAAFRENGVDVTEIPQDLAFNTGAQAFGDLLISGGLAALKPSLCMYVRTHNRTALGKEWSDTWERLRATGIATCSAHLDRFFDLPREELVWNGDPLFTVGYCFTADGGDHPWTRAGVNHHFLPPAVDRTEAEWGGTPRRGWQYDVVFIGSSDRTYHTQYPQRGELLRHLRDTYGQRFAHFGHGGTHPNVRQSDLNDVLAGCKVVIGDSCFANEPSSPRSTRYVSDRVFESVGRSTGAVLIHPYVPGIRDWLTGSELALHAPGDWDDLDAQIGAFLANPGEREGYVTRGRARVLRDHTYGVRAAEILRTVGLTANAETRTG